MTHFISTREGCVDSDGNFCCPFIGISAPGFFEFLLGDFPVGVCEGAEFICNAENGKWINISQVMRNKFKAPKWCKLRREEVVVYRDTSKPPKKKRGRRGR